MRFFAVVFAFLLALIAGTGGAFATQARPVPVPASSVSMPAVPMAASAAGGALHAGAGSAAAAVVADLGETPSDSDDRTEAIVCGACGLPMLADALVPVAARPGGTPRLWLARLLRPPRSAQG